MLDSIIYLHFSKRFKEYRSSNLNTYCVTSNLTILHQNLVLHVHLYVTMSVKLYSIK